MAFAAFIPLIAAAVGAIGGAIRDRKQQKENRKLAEFQHSANKELLNEQLEYDKPKNQMARFQDAGLNPNLIYGQGSPGNQGQPLSYPDIKPTDYTSLMNMIPAFNQTRMVDAQVNAQNATTLQKNALTEVAKMQEKLIRANPLLNDEGFTATIDGLKNTALLKAEQAGGQKLDNFINEASSGHQVNKVFREIQLLEQKFDLGNQDKAIKAETLKSKEFANAILEVQKKFMVDGEVTPQHIVQFIQLLLQKSL